MLKIIVIKMCPTGLNCMIAVQKYYNSTCSFHDYLKYITVNMEDMMKFNI